MGVGRHNHITPNHITPNLRELHWLPLQQRVRFNPVTFGHKSLHGATPTDCRTIAAAILRQPDDDDDRSKTTVSPLLDLEHGTVCLSLSARLTFPLKSLDEN